MGRFRRYLIVGAACVVVAMVLSSALRAQTRGAKIEVKGVAAQVDANAGTFTIEGLTVKTTTATRYEDRQDRRVNKAEFFSNFHANDRVEVEGSLNGNVVTAHEIEIKHR